MQQLRAGSGLHAEPVSVAGLHVQPEGDVHALVTLGRCTGVIVVTLNGRPIEQYQHLVGTNGWLRADYVTASVTEVAGPGTGAGILFTPYRRALQAISSATAGFARRFLYRQSSYLGLQRLIGRFYAAILDGGPAPVSARSILDTVGICEQIGRALDEAERQRELAARAQLERTIPPPVHPSRPRVLVTGGTGQLGRRVAQELGDAGFAVRVVARRAPAYSVRLPGVEYVAGDLTRPIDAAVTEGIGVIVHCAAETAGGRADHERNSIAATRHVIEAAARAGAKVVHVSSLAVLAPAGRRRLLDESSPVDAGNLGRGPYVWGKAESELLAQRLGQELQVPLAVVRPGPLVDSDAFQAPGRLGREVGPVFVAVGGRRTPLDVCDVGNAARVIRSYVEDFDAAPAILNLVDSPAPTRAELAGRLRAARPDLRIVWLPRVILRVVAGPLKVFQRVALGVKEPVDVCSAFSSERYRTTLAHAVAGRAGAATGPRRFPTVSRRLA